MLQGNNLVNLLVSLFQTNGFPKSVIPWAIAQVMHETGGKIDRPLEQTYFNISGINYVGQKLATRGVTKPVKEWKNKNVAEYYAKYRNYDDWAKDYKRILSSNRGGKGKPIEAPTLTEFLNRLSANYYFADLPSKYSIALTRWLNQIKSMLPPDLLPIILLAIGLIILI
jgi:flagellum-specific peptidoglycan hydrolase FlgJ